MKNVAGIKEGRQPMELPPPICHPGSLKAIGEAFVRIGKHYWNKILKLGKDRGIPSEVNLPGVSSNKTAKSTHEVIQFNYF